MNDTLDLFDVTEARAARDKGLQQVTQNSGAWVDRAMAEINLFLPPGEYTGEDIRRWLTERKIVPHHHNAWGALCRVAMLRGLIRDTGKIVHMKAKRSHARRTPLYRRGA